MELGIRASQVTFCILLPSCKMSRSRTRIDSRLCPFQHRAGALCEDCHWLLLTRSVAHDSNYGIQWLQNARYNQRVEVATVALNFRLCIILYISISFYIIISFYISFRVTCSQSVASCTASSQVLMETAFHCTNCFIWRDLFLEASQHPSRVVPVIQVMYCQETISHRRFHRCRIWNNYLTPWGLRGITWGNKEWTLGFICSSCTWHDSKSSN